MNSRTCCFAYRHGPNLACKSKHSMCTDKLSWVLRLHEANGVEKYQASMITEIYRWSRVQLLKKLYANLPLYTDFVSLKKVVACDAIAVNSRMYFYSPYPTCTLHVALRNTPKPCLTPYFFCTTLSFSHGNIKSEKN